MAQRTSRTMLGVVLLALIGCSDQKPTYHYEGVPATSDILQPIRLRVVYAVNPRFERFSDEQIATALTELRLRAKQLANVDLEFDRVSTLDVQDLFGTIPPRVRRAFEALTVDLDTPLNSGEVSVLVESATRSLKADGASPASVYAFAERDLLRKPRSISYPDLAEVLLGQQLDNLDPWRSQLAKDGRPILDGSGLNSWALWKAIGYGTAPYDLVLTNQLIASVEWDGLDVHSALRGGMTLGTTAYSASGKLGAFIFATTFPFQNQSPHMVRLRGGETYGDDEAAKLFGYYLVHEIGHLIYRYGHPFDRSECYMAPAAMVRMRQWANDLAPAKCPETPIGPMSRNAVRLSKLVLD